MVQVLRHVSQAVLALGIVGGGVLAQGDTLVWDTVHVTVRTATNVAIGSDTTLSGLGAGGSSVDVDSADTQVTVFDTVKIIDTLAISSGALTVNGTVTCRALVARGGSIAGGAADTLFVRGDADFAGLGDSVVGVGTVVVYTDSADVTFKHGDKIYNNLVLWAASRARNLEILVSGPGTVRVDGDLSFWDNQDRQSYWTFNEDNQDVVVRGDVSYVKKEGNGQAPRTRMGSGTWTLYGDVQIGNGYHKNDLATVVLAGDSIQALSIGGRGVYEVPTVIHSGNGTVVLSANQQFRSFTQTAGSLDLNGFGLEVLGDFVVSGSGAALTGMTGDSAIVAGGSTRISGVSSDTFLVAESASSWSMSAGGVLQAAYVQLRNCTAARSGGVAFMSADSGGNVNWTFLDTDQPVVTVQPSSVLAVVGDSVTFRVGAASMGELSVAWHRNDTAVAGGSDILLVLAGVQAADSGAVFYAVVSDAAANSDTSEVCTLRVVDPPRFTQQISGSRNRYVGEAFSLSVSALGAGNLTYAWYLNDSLYGTGASFAADSVTKALNGAALYCVVTTDDAAYAAVADTTPTVVLVVYHRLAITLQPAPLLVAPGASGNLSVSVASDTLAAFQWYRNGTAIANATDSVYAIDSASASDTGSYYVEVMWDAGRKLKSSTVTVQLGSGLMARAVQPLRFGMGRVYPNPFVGTAVLRFAIPSPARVSLAVYDMRGKLVRNLVDPSRELRAGHHVASWNGRDERGALAASGQYICRLVAGNDVADTRLTLVR